MTPAVGVLALMAWGAAWSDPGALPAELAAGARECRTDAIRSLLAGRADPNSVDGQGRTALHLAAYAGCTDAMNVLLEHGANIEARDKSGIHPLFAAVGSLHRPGNPAALEALLARGANPDALVQGSPALHKAAVIGSEAMVEALLARGARLDAVDKHRETALMDAARQGNSRVVRLLLARGAQPNLRNESGQTALHKAVFGGNGAAVRDLLAAGAAPNVADKDGWTPLMHAAEGGLTDLLKALVAAGADPEAENEAGSTARTLEVKRARLLAGPGGRAIREREDEQACRNGLREELDALLGSGTAIPLVVFPPGAPKDRSVLVKLSSSVTEERLAKLGVRERLSESLVRHRCPQAAVRFDVHRKMPARLPDDRRGPLDLGPKGCALALALLILPIAAYFAVVLVARRSEEAVHLRIRKRMSLVGGSAMILGAGVVCWITKDDISRALAAAIVSAIIGAMQCYIGWTARSTRQMDKFWGNDG